MYQFTFAYVPLIFKLCPWLSEQLNDLIFFQFSVTSRKKKYSCTTSWQKNILSRETLKDKKFMLLENPPPPHNFSNGPSLKESKSSRGGGRWAKTLFLYTRIHVCTCQNGYATPLRGIHKIFVKLAECFLRALSIFQNENFASYQNYSASWVKS